MKKSTELITKIADTREPEYIKSRLALLGWQITALNVGDYMFQGNNSIYIGITRKTVNDLLSSMITVFGYQLEGFLRRYNRCILLLEGEMRALPPTYKIAGEYRSSKFTWDMVWNFLRTWQDRGITIERTIDNDHTIHRLESLVAYYQKTEHYGGIKS